MKKYLFIFKGFAFLFIAALFSGCLKDTTTHTSTYSWYEPLYKTKAEVIADIKSNPPREIEHPGKIFINGKNIYLNETGRGIHIIDNSVPSSPKNIAFITIAGNVDMAIKGNTLYADLYNDLVTLDITNPLQVVKTKIVENAFPYSPYSSYGGDSSLIIYDWERHDTIVVSDDNPPQQVWPGGVYYNAPVPMQNANSSSSQKGIAGSMARFALVNNYLYTVDDTYLNVFNIANSNDPLFLNKTQVDWHVETIYPFKNNLFVGSNNGMFIYDVNSSPANPLKVGEFTHARACDPVIADDNYAYVTLHSGTTCLGYNNQLDVVKLNDLTNAELAKTYNLTSPHGLSKDGNLLFICDGADGLKIYNADDVDKIKLIKHFAGIETYDVIANGNVALVVAKDGLYQYDYSNINNIHLLSKINIAE